MDSPLGALRPNNEAVVQEWREAVANGDLDLAWRIATANPNLFDDDGEPLWQYVV